MILPKRKLGPDKKYVFLKGAGGTPANECCCESNVSPCNIISVALCYDANAWGCGFDEFLGEGEAAGCPPRKFRTRTEIYSISGTEKTDLTWPGDNQEYLLKSFSYVYTKVTTKNVECEDVEECSGNWSWEIKWMSVREGVEENAISDSGSGDDCTPPPITSVLPEYIVAGKNCEETINTRTSQQRVCTFSAPGFTAPGTTGFYGIANLVEDYLITLSDEIQPVDSAENCSANTPCDASVDGPFCDPCCTDRGGHIPGLMWMGWTPECLQPWETTVAWDASNCAEDEYKGRSVTHYLWFKFLTPGQKYRVTIFFTKCQFALDPVTLTPIVPGCKFDGPCLDGTYVATAERSLEFTAEHWAEILGLDADCRVARIKCQLEDEADNYNATKASEAPERSVGFTHGYIVSPVETGFYTFLDHCALETLP